MKSYDGSAAVYRTWLKSLRELGCTVSLLSFNTPRAQWRQESLDELTAAGVKPLIVNVHRTLFGAFVPYATALMWRFFSGKRFLPARIDALFAPTRHAAVANFIAQNDFDAIIVNKVRTTTLFGIANLTSFRGYKIQDVHDNSASRTRQIRSAVWRLLRKYPTAVVRQLRFETVSDLMSRASEGRMMREEVEILDLYDKVLFCSEEEAERFTRAGLDRQKISRISWAANVSPKKLPEEDHRSTRRAYHIGFLASSALFNVEAACFLTDEILPRVKQKMPDIRVVVAGSVVLPAARILSREPCITMLPQVERVEEFYRCVDVVVIPLLSGTGVSIKALEAAASGAAIVSTCTGARGLNLRSGVDIVLAETAEQFAGEIERLLLDDKLRRWLGANARARAGAGHSPQVFQREIRQCLQDVCVRNT